MCPLPSVSSPSTPPVNDLCLLDSFISTFKSFIYTRFNVSIILTGKFQFLGQVEPSSQSRCPSYSTFRFSFPVAGWVRCSSSQSWGSTKFHSVWYYLRDIAGTVSQLCKDTLRNSFQNWLVRGTRSCILQWRIKNELNILHARTFFTQFLETIWDTMTLCVIFSKAFTFCTSL